MSKKDISKTFTIIIILYYYGYAYCSTEGLTNLITTHQSVTCKLNLYINMLFEANKYLPTHCNMSRSSGVARDGSLWINVARTTIHRPIVSSSYCSSTVLHSGQRSTTMVSLERDTAGFFAAA